MPPPSRDRPLDADDLVTLGGRYASEEMFDEAIHLYEMALRLKPDSESIRQKLDDTHSLLEIAESKRFAPLESRIREQRSAEELDCSQYIGLAAYYIATDQTTRAIEMLEIAKLRSPNNHEPYARIAAIHFADGEWELARTELEAARRINPFSRSLAEIAGRVEFELESNDAALRHFVDAFLLTPDKRGEGAEPTRRMIRTLERVIGIEHHALLAMIRRQLDDLALAAERLEIRKESLFRLESRAVLDEIFHKVHREAEKRGNLIALSAELRDLSAFHHLRDEQLLRLARFTKIENVDAGGYLCHEGDRSMSFCVVRSGSFEVRRETPVGPQLFATAGTGQILGEMNFLDRTIRSTDVVATEPSSCYTFAFSAVDQVSENDRETAVALHWAFWRSLAEKIRTANDQLRTFFPHTDVQLSQESRNVETAAPAGVGRLKKLHLLQERGLSAAEMRLLATFSADEKFHAGGAIFREGEPGESLYIVLDGKVRISKTIPGIGEEALAILGRGDFFGEMALVDRQLRSADAIAHMEDTTVLAIDRNTLHEVLSLDPRAALQFLNLLCRMISRKLREIDDKIVHWKCMSGGF